MVINKKVVKKKLKKIVFYKLYIFFSLKFVGIVFVSSLFDSACASIIPSHVTTESSVMLANYFSFLKLHVATFQT